MHGTEVYVEVEVLLHTFLASALYGVSGQLHASVAVPLRKLPTALAEWEACWPRAAGLGRFVEGVNILYRLGPEPHFLSCPVRSPFTVSTVVSRRPHRPQIH